MICMGYVPGAGALPDICAWLPGDARHLRASAYIYIYIYISRLMVVSREAKEKVPRDERT